MNTTFDIEMAWTSADRTRRGQPELAAEVVRMPYARRAEQPVFKRLRQRWREVDRELAEEIMKDERLLRRLEARPLPGWGKVLVWAIVGLMIAVGWAIYRAA